MMNHLHKWDVLRNKIVDQDALGRIIASKRMQDQRVVFTNGCFDILHFGHIYYLAKARDLGDLLVVGLNSDASVTRLKGPLRPINEQYHRAFLLAALQVVDFVTIFEEDTPQKLIEKLRPQILVKGGDYKSEEVVGGDLVRSWGGSVNLIDFVPGLSTTNIISKTTDGEK
jgi:D-beta-D-heptose 7-phosphate kinase / D-beta-D-heptose 1-phosphate adenosyltransferase